MTAQERRSSIFLALIFAFRMLGLFMILPVFALYAEELAGVTPTLVGLAIGIYGMTQAALQIPFGMASDRFGRKPVIAFGLLLFALGSVVAAMADTITGVILGRALQGSGAVAAAVMALAADLTREEQRTKAMAFIGASIGFSFLAAMIGGPLLGEWIGVPGIFWLTAVLALVGIGILYMLVPDPANSRHHRDTQPVPAQFAAALRNPELLRLDFGILTLHLILTSTFVVLPLMLRDAGLAADRHWTLYLPVMVLAMAAAVPFIIVAEKKRWMKQVVSGAVALLTASVLLLSSQVGGSVWGIALMLVLYFAAFNLLEASLPSLIAKTAPADGKGTAMGLYSSSQFLGAFIGGLTGGLLFEHFGAGAVFTFAGAVAAMWWLLVLTMAEPRYLSTRLLNIGRLDRAQALALELEMKRVPGVAEVAVNVDDGIAYLKVDSQALDAAALGRFSAAET